jgi:hypothetical protein
VRSARESFLVLLALSALVAHAGDAKSERVLKMDYGPFLSTSLVQTKIPKGVQGGPKSKYEPTVIATKALLIKLPGKTPAGVCFDTDTLALSLGWTGGYLNLKDSMLALHKGTDNVTIDGEVSFSTSGPGWARSGSFSDPRVKAQGPLPKDWAHYKGLYVHGDRVVLKYTVGGAEVLESIAYETVENVNAFSRTIRIEKSTEPLTLCIGDIASGKEAAEKKDILETAVPANTVIVASAGSSGVSTAATVLGAPADAKLNIAGAGSIVLKLPPIATPTTFKVLIWRGKDLNSFHKAASTFTAPEDIKALTRGGAPHWKPLETVGKLGTGNGAYVVDTLTVPEDNPYNSWMRTSAIDFFPDGRAAVSTFNGDVWIVNGIDEKLEKLIWTRFATGLYEPLGLKVVDGSVYVRGRDQITKLHDLNFDGEADYYENFNNDDTAHYAYHCFAMDLQTDSAGNFYYARCGRRSGPDAPDHGNLIKISKDGTKKEIVATGLRTANGMGIGPNDQLICGDNQGEWTPSSRINIIKKGDFLGHVYQHHLPKTPTDYTRPLCWVPHNTDTSCGGQAWVSGDKWGPLKDHYVHTSFGKSALLYVLMEDSGGVLQGGVVSLPLVFDTGIMRPQFNPRDGQLYVTGVGGGWQTSGVKDGNLNRIRYTGKPANLPVSLKIESTGIRIGFSDALEKASAADDQNYGIEQWNYEWTEKYGSPDFSVADPKKKGHDAVAIKAVKMIDDKTIFLEVPGLKPVMQMQITCKIKGVDGAAINLKISNTIHRVP